MNILTKPTMILKKVHFLLQPQKTFCSLHLKKYICKKRKCMICLQPMVFRNVFTNILFGVFIIFRNLEYLILG